MLSAEDPSLRIVFVDSVPWNKRVQNTYPPSSNGVSVAAINPLIYKLEQNTSI